MVKDKHIAHLKSPFNLSFHNEDSVKRLIENLFR